MTKISYKCKILLNHTNVGVDTMKLTRLPDTELEVMKVVWQKGNGVSTSQIKEVQIGRASCRERV